MRQLLFFIFIFLLKDASAQDKPAIKQANAFLQTNKIKLNRVVPLKDFRVYYNCDSMLFMRGNFGDTIKIWTPGTETPEELVEFKKTIQHPDFGTTQFAKEVENDGRILVIRNWETIFVFRHDSLYQIENANPLPAQELESIFKVFFEKAVEEKNIDSQTIDEKALEEKMHAYNKKAAAQAVYKAKLVFAKTMFTNNIKKVKLKKRVNFMEDTIVLENKWKENGKNCYLIRIKNKSKDGTETSYAYAINENIKFVWWEGCNEK